MGASFYSVLRASAFKASIDNSARSYRPGRSSTPLQTLSSGCSNAAMATGFAPPQPISQNISPGFGSANFKKGAKY